MLELATAVAVAITLEGVLYALFPTGMKRMMIHVIDQPSPAIRAAGLAAAAFGVFLVWLLRGA